MQYSEYLKIIHNKLIYCVRIYFYIDWDAFTDIEGVSENFHSVVLYFVCSALLGERLIFYVFEIIESFRRRDTNITGELL